MMVKMLFLLLLLILCHASCEMMESSYNTGSFTVHFNPELLPTIKITEQERVVWFSSPSYTPLMYAEKVLTNVTQIGGDFTLKETVLQSCTTFEMAKFVRIPTDHYSQIVLQGTLCGVSATITFQATDVIATGDNVTHTHLSFNVSMVENQEYNQIRLAYGCQEDEGFFGFGAQYSVLNMKGRELPLFLSEQGVGRGLQPVTFLLDTLSEGAGDWPGCS